MDPQNICKVIRLTKEQKTRDLTSKVLAKIDVMQTRVPSETGDV